MSRSPPILSPPRPVSPHVISPIAHPAPEPGLRCELPHARALADHQAAFDDARAAAAHEEATARLQTLRSKLAGMRAEKRPGVAPEPPTLLPAPGDLLAQHQEHLQRASAAAQQQAVDMQLVEMMVQSRVQVAQLDNLCLSLSSGG